MRVLNLRNDDSHGAAFEHLLDDPPDVLIALRRDTNERRETLLPAVVPCLGQVAQPRTELVNHVWAMLLIDEDPDIARDRRPPLFEGFDEAIEADVWLRADTLRSRQEHRAQCPKPADPPRPSSGAASGR